MVELDCLGMVCPQPVLAVKDALTEMESGRLLVRVDNEAAKENVTRFVKSQGSSIKAEVNGAGYVLTVTKTDPVSAPVDTALGPAQETAPRGKIVIRISNRYMGSGADELGGVLMRAFIKTLRETSPLPETMIFYNSGVYLTSESSDSLSDLRELESAGVMILSCGTCLDYFNLGDKAAVGLVTNMFEIVNLLSGAERVISP